MNPTQESKKSSSAKIAINVIGIILLIPLVLVAIIVVSLITLSASHGSELKKLENETTSLFDKSGFNASGYDCHDVELRNQCYFRIGATSSKVAIYLQQQGFSKDNTYGDGYKKGELYITGDQDGSYASYYISGS